MEELYRDWFLASDQAERQRIARELQVQTLREANWIPVAQVFLPTVLRADVAGVLPGFAKFWNVRRS